MKQDALIVKMSNEISDLKSENAKLREALKKIDALPVYGEGYYLVKDVEAAIEQAKQLL